jgi:hypothetical protein
MALLGWLVAKPSPFDFPRFSADGGRVGAIFVLCALGVALVFVASFLFSNYLPHLIT